MEFDPFSYEYFNDPYDVYRHLRDETPVYYNEQYDFWALSRFEDVVRAHRDYSTFSSAYGVSLDELSRPGKAPGSSLIMTDPPEHDRLRKLVSRVFTPRALDGLEPTVRGIVREYLDPHATADGFDVVADFSGPFPVEVISEMLGIPKADRQQLRHWTDDMLTREPGELRPSAKAMDSGLRFALYALEFAKDRRKHPGTDFLSELTQVEVPGDDGSTHHLTDEEIAGFCSLIAAAGSETVTKLIGNGAVQFAHHPDQWRTVVEDPTALTFAVEEILRFEPPSQYQGRFSVRDSQWHGIVIPAGHPVLLLTGAATRDERAFEDPDRFDITRRPNLSLGFGHGIHSCLGAALARLESRVAFEELARDYPRFTIDSGGLARVQMSNVAGYSNVPLRRAA